MAIGLSHGGTNVYSAPSGSRELWVATQDGLVLFERGESGHWRESRRALRGNHISSITFEPTSGMMFALTFRSMRIAWFAASSTSARIC